MRCNYRGHLEEVYFSSGCNECAYVLIMPSKCSGVSSVNGVGGGGVHGDKPH